jgi:predicted ATPase
MALGGSLMTVRSLAAPEAGKAYARALELCRRAGETHRLFPVLVALFAFHLARGELRAARELAEQQLRLAQSVQNPAVFQHAHYAMAQVFYDLGQLLQSRTHLEQAIALYDPQNRTFRAFHDPGVACLGVAALTLHSLGYPDQALKRIRESLTLARKLSHPFSLALALSCAAELFQFRREAAATQEYAETLTALSHEQGFSQWEAEGVTLRGWALSKQGRTDEGIVYIRQGLAATQSTGAALWQRYFSALMAEACSEAGQPEEGLRTVREGFDLASECALNEPVLYQLKGGLLLQQDESRAAQAETCFQRAIKVARKQSAKSRELQAMISLTRLYAKQGRTHEAHHMLAEIYNWFTEGFETADLKEAKALLYELSR